MFLAFRRGAAEVAAVVDRHAGEGPWRMTTRV
jgi:hypothetical protein